MIHSDSSIDVLGLSPRTANALHRNGIHSLSDLQKCVPKLDSLHYIGASAIKEIESVITQISSDLEENDICLKYPERCVEDVFLHEDIEPPLPPANLTCWLESLPKRNAEIIKLKLQGITDKKIGECFEISSQRVNQIVKREKARAPKQFLDGSSVNWHSPKTSVEEAKGFSHKAVIRKVMRDIGVTQKELGELLGNGQSAISSILSRDDIYLSTFVRILNVLGYELAIQKSDK